MASSPASALTLNLGDGGLLGGGGGGGGLLGLGGGGDSGGGTSATVNTDNLDNGQTQGIVRTNLLGGSSDNDATATLDLGGAGNDTLLDLFGDGGGGNDGPTTATFNLGGGDGATGSARLGLFGDGGLTGGDSGVALDLFGSGTGGGAGGGTGGTGGIGGDGGAGSNGGTGGFGGTGINLADTRIASLGDMGTGRCFLPNAQQVQTLVKRHAYVQSTFNAWGTVGDVKVVDVGLCPTAAPEIVGNANIDRLQDFVGRHPALRSRLDALGHAPGDVIGMDKNGQTLVIYVM